MIVLKKTMNTTHNVGKVKTLLKKTKKTKISTGTPGAQVRLDIVFGFWVFCFFSVGSSLLLGLGLEFQFFSVGSSLLLGMVSGSLLFSVGSSLLLGLVP